MSKKQRIDIIKKIENKRSSKIITYFTGERKGLFRTNIANDVIILFRKHLDKIGQVEVIDLFLYSQGGEMMTPLRLVKLIREYCKSFNVLIPYRALSAATLIALGANEIWMGQLGELTPVDPTTDHTFNPIDPSDPSGKKRVSISVEDVTSYFMLATEKAKIRNEQMVNVFNELANKIHPLSLGAIYRGYRMIRMLAEKSLKLHMDSSKDKDRINDIIKKITEELCIHNYLISREEAEKEVNLNIKKPDNELEQLMWKLYLEYDKDLQLETPFIPIQILADKTSKSFSTYGALIESESIFHGFYYKIDLKKIKDQAGKETISMSVVPIGWREI